MAFVNFSKGMACLVLGSAFATSALAGGFSRGSADTDILYEDGSAALRAGLIYVMPSRDYDTISGVPSHDAAFTDNYVIPNAAVKVRLFEALSCAATYTQPFGASSTFGIDAQTADSRTPGSPNSTSRAKLVTNEYAATCAAKFAAGAGNVYFLGGVFVQSFDYQEFSRFGTLRLEDDSALGYRLGMAYDIPEYALRAQVLYRSQVDHKLDGSFTVSSIGSRVFPFATGTVLPSNGAGSSPQSVKVSLQSGIAEGWLAYGSVEWTDWSVLPVLNYAVTGIGPQRKVFNFQDGWTIQGGIAHSFSEDVAGTVNLTWDRGVGTGADLMTDTWTLGVGAQIKVGPGALRLGGGVSYLTAGEQSIAKGALFNATSDGDWAVGLSTSYLIKF